MLLHSSVLFHVGGEQRWIQYPLYNFQTSGPTEDLGKQCERATPVTAFNPCSIRSIRSQQQVLLCSLSSPAQSSSLLLLNILCEELQGVEGQLYLISAKLSGRSPHDSIFFFLVKRSTRFTLMSWKSYFCSKAGQMSCLPRVQKLFVFVFQMVMVALGVFFISVGFSKTISTESLIRIVTCPVSSFFQLHLNFVNLRTALSIFTFYMASVCLRYW